jgi:phosphoglycerate dehydrogenase-like enzyme
LSELPDVLNVLVFRGGAAAVERIRDVAPERLRVSDFADEYGEELAREWPGLPAWWTPGAGSGRSRAERDALLADSHVLLLGLPFLKKLPTWTPKLLWAHFTFAGVSNLMGSGWWGLEGPLVTSSRGANGALPIAETALAGALMLAKRLDRAVRDTQAGQFTDRAHYLGMPLLAGKTIGIVGLGGIGGQLARLAHGLGMRVLATRRSAQTRERDVDGVDELFPSAELPAMLAECDFVAVCVMWTPETERMLNTAAFDAMKPGVILVNVARGEIIDEDALADALRSGQVGGAYLDVWADDILGELPQPALRAAPNTVFTPHVSGQSDVSHAFSLELFIENLGRLLRGEELRNVIDWTRGY